MSLNFEFHYLPKKTVGLVLSRVEDLTADSWISKQRAIYEVMMAHGIDLEKKFNPFDIDFRELMGSPIEDELEDEDADDEEADHSLDPHDIVEINPHIEFLERVREYLELVFQICNDRKRAEGAFVALAVEKSGQVRGFISGLLEGKTGEIMWYTIEPGSMDEEMQTDFLEALRMALKDLHFKKIIAPLSSVPEEDEQEFTEFLEKRGYVPIKDEEDPVKYLLKLNS